MIGWAGIQNGELLARAVEAGFDVLITMDGNMVNQRNIGRHPIAVIALKAKSNRLDDTSPLMRFVGDPALRETGHDHVCPGVINARKRKHEHSDLGSQTRRHSGAATACMGLLS